MDEYMDKRMTDYGWMKGEWITRWTHSIPIIPQFIGDDSQELELQPVIVEDPVSELFIWYIF